MAGKSKISKDMETLLGLMERLGQGDFSPADKGIFENPEIGQAFNNMIEGINTRDNRFLVRLNDAQRRIADNANAKNMLQLIQDQQNTISQISNSRSVFSVTMEDSIRAGLETLALAKQSKNMLEFLDREIKQTLEKYQGEALSEESVTELKKTMEFAYEQLEEMRAVLDTIKTDALGVYEKTSENLENTRDFLGQVDSIVASFSDIYSYCFETGRQLYRISRDVDEARNDCYRQNSYPTIIDRLHVFDVDHLTLAWRLYNNIVEFESLKITQVNNPTGCKFGKWCREQDGTPIAQLEGFKKSMDAHEEFHKYAVDCFLMKEASRIPEALVCFDRALEAYGLFRDALKAFRDELRTKGESDETDLWVFGGLNNNTYVK